MNLETDTVPLGFNAIDELMPMHAVIARTGHIHHVGPTLAKLNSQTDMIGARILEVFEIRRPGNVGSLKDLILLAGKNSRFGFAMHQGRI